MTATLPFSASPSSANCGTDDTIVAFKNDAEMKKDTVES
jgi:hypothetical protein